MVNTRSMCVYSYCVAVEIVMDTNNGPAGKFIEWTPDLSLKIADHHIVMVVYGQKDVYKDERLPEDC